MFSFVRSPLFVLRLFVLPNSFSFIRSPLFILHYSLPIINSFSDYSFSISHPTTAEFMTLSYMTKNIDQRFQPPKSGKDAPTNYVDRFIFLQSFFNRSSICLPSFFNLSLIVLQAIKSPSRFRKAGRQLRRHEWPSMCDPRR